MEYETKVKQIGGSSYLRLPPKLVKQYKLKDQSEVHLRESDRMFVVETENPRMDKYTKEFLDMRFKLGGKTVTREEIYETDRY